MPAHWTISSDFFHSTTVVDVDLTCRVLIDSVPGFQIEGDTYTRLEAERRQEIAERQQRGEKVMADMLLGSLRNAAEAIGPCVDVSMIRENLVLMKGRICRKSIHIVFGTRCDYAVVTAIAKSLNTLDYGSFQVREFGEYNRDRQGVD